MKSNYMKCSETYAKLIMYTDLDLFITKVITLIRPNVLNQEVLIAVIRLYIRLYLV